MTVSLNSEEELGLAARIASEARKKEQAKQDTWPAVDWTLRCSSCKSRNSSRSLWVGNTCKPPCRWQSHWWVNCPLGGPPHAGRSRTPLEIRVVAVSHCLDLKSNCTKCTSLPQPSWATTTSGLAFERRQTLCASSAPRELSIWLGSRAPASTWS